MRQVPGPDYCASGHRLLDWDMADLPEGFIYRPGFAGPDEERALLDRAREIEFRAVEMYGVTARRRVAHFGRLYAFGSGKIEPGPPIPDFLLPLRERLAGLAGVEAGRLAEALVIEYPAGAGIGWHRDAPPFGIVAAFSLLSRCRFKLRHGASGRARATLDIEPRSAYILSGAARWRWQHGIAPAEAPRYSITFRTLRGEADRAVETRGSSAALSGVFSPERSVRSRSRA